MVCGEGVAQLNRAALRTYSGGLEGDLDIPGLAESPYCMPKADGSSCFPKTDPSVRPATSRAPQKGDWAMKLTDVEVSRPQTPYRSLATLARAGLCTKSHASRLTIIFRGGRT